MALLFNDVEHQYFLDGEHVPSVTQVLRDSGLVRLDGIPEFILEAARKRGTAVHALAHYANEGDLDWSSVDDAYRGYLDAWMAYRQERQVVALLCEYRVASKRHRVAGTIDLLADIAGESWLLDYATGNPADVSKDLQTAAYLGLAMERAKDDARLAAVMRRSARWRRGAIRLRKDGTFRFTEYTDAFDYTAFQTLAAAWHIRAERGAVLQPDDLAA